MNKKTKRQHLSSSGYWGVTKYICSNFSNEISLAETLKSVPNVMQAQIRRLKEVSQTD